MGCAEDWGVAPTPWCCFCRDPHPERDGFQEAAPGHGGVWPGLHGRGAEPHLQHLHTGKNSLPAPKKCFPHLWVNGELMW